MATRGERTTVMDVARHAGVSKQTVSRVLNSAKEVAESTRERVQKAIKELKFRPSALARNLSTGRSYTIGIVGPGLFFLGTDLYLGIAKAAEELGYTLVLKRVNDNDRASIELVVHELLDIRVDGILWAVPDRITTDNWSKAGLLKQLAIPIIFLSSKKRPNTIVMTFDNCNGAGIATQHLIDIGRKRIAHISGPSDWWTAQERIRGWRETIEHAGLAADESLLVEGNWLAESGQIAFTQLIESGVKFDALFAGNDRMALGAMLEAHRRGIRIPDQLAVVGMDNSPESTCYFPPLTTVTQHKQLLGEAAMQNLIALVEKTLPLKRTALHHELLVRESAPLKTQGKK